MKLSKNAHTRPQQASQGHDTSNSSTRFGRPSESTGMPNVTFQNSNVLATSPAPPPFPAKLRLYSGSTFPPAETDNPGISAREESVGVEAKVDMRRVKMLEALPVG